MARKFLTEPKPLSYKRFVPKNYTAVEMERIKRSWRERLTDYDFRELPFTKQGGLLGVSPTTVSKWHSELTPAAWANIQKMTLEKIAPQSVRVNDALYQKCLQGDVAAIKLWKESIEGWIPRQDMGVARLKDKEVDAMTNEELARVALEELKKDSVDSLGGTVVDVAAKELKEMTGGSGESEWTEKDRTPPVGNTIYTRKAE